MRSVRLHVSFLLVACAFGVGCARLEMSSHPVNATAVARPESGPSRNVRPLQPPPTRPQRKDDAERVFRAIYYARQLASRNPDAAIADLEPALGRWPGYDAEFHFGIAMAVDKKIFRSARGSKQRLDLFKRKLQHLKKALACIDAGGKWASDPMETRTPNLKLSIEQARIAIKRLSSAPPPADKPAPGRP